MSDNYFNEKRDFMRMQMECTMYYGSEQGEPNRAAELVNLSANGLLFNTDEELVPGERLSVAIQPPSAVTPPLKGIATVCRCHVTEGGDRYAIACEMSVAD